MYLFIKLFISSIITKEINFILKELIIFSLWFFFFKKHNYVNYFKIFMNIFIIKIMF